MNRSFKYKLRHLRAVELYILGKRATGQQGRFYTYTEDKEGILGFIYFITFLV